MELSQVIIKPYNTEKSYGLRSNETRQTLTFIVDRRATKHLIKLAFKALYKVEVDKINILNRKSTVTKVSTAHPGRTKAFKLAYIVLPKGVNVAVTKEEIEEATKESIIKTSSKKSETSKNQSTDKNVVETTIKE